MRNGVFIQCKITSPPKNINYNGKNGNITAEMSERHPLNQMFKVNIISNETNQNCMPLHKMLWSPASTKMILTS